MIAVADSEFREQAGRLTRLLRGRFARRSGGATEPDDARGDDQVDSRA